MRNIKLLGLAGSSGSGKSTTAGLIAEQYESQGVKCQVISLDDFYRDGLDPVTTNWDDPAAFDHERFAQFLRELRENGMATYPVYDFATSSRRKDKVNQTAPGASLFIFEGIFAHHPAINNLYDLTVFVDTQPELCLARRKARDIAERGSTAEKVERDWQTFVYPAFQQHILPRKDEADIVVTNNVVSRGIQFDLSGLMHSIKARLSSSVKETLGRVSCSLFPRVATSASEFAFSELDIHDFRATVPGRR